MENYDRAIIRDFQRRDGGEKLRNPKYLFLKRAVNGVLTVMRRHHVPMNVIDASREIINPFDAMQS